MSERAGRLLGLMPAWSAQWAARRERLSAVWDGETLAAADLAVARLRAAVELLVDQLYLEAFSRTAAGLSVQTLHITASAADSGQPGIFDSLAALAGGGLGDDLRTAAELIAAEAADVRAGRWREIAWRWARIDTGPPAEDPPGTLISGDHVVVNTGGGGDRVLIEPDPDTGDWRVTVNGRLSVFPAECRLTVRTGAGDDRVTVRGPRGVTILSGYGNDVLIGGDGDDILLGGPGNDFLSGDHRALPRAGARLRLRQPHAGERAACRSARPGHGRRSRRDADRGAQ